MVTEDKREVNPGLLGETPPVAVAGEGEGLNGRGREGGWEDNHQDR